MSALTETLSSLKSAAARHERVVVGYSGGKDSVVVLDLCMKFFKQVVAFHMYFVPGLRCVEAALTDAQARYPGLQIIQLPHWAMIRAIREGIYCNNTFRTDDMPTWELKDVYRAARAEAGATIVATGAKSSDSMWRRRMLGSWGRSDDVLYPILEWNKFDVLGYLGRHGLTASLSTERAASGIDLSAPSLLWLHDIPKITRGLFGSSPTPKRSCGGASFMASAKKKTPPATKSFERFKVETLPRRDLKGAPYNPRTMSATRRRKLKAGLQRLGMLQPVVWNRKSGLLVGGHQRLSILDDLNGGRDYELQVAVVELDAKQEREANLLLNNDEAQGEWDLEKLAGMFKGDDAADATAAGFDPADIFRLFGDDAASIGAGTAVEAMAETLRETRERLDKTVRAVIDKRDTVNNYLVFVFADEAGRDAFCARYGLENNRFQSGAELETLLSKDVV